MSLVSCQTIFLVFMTIIFSQEPVILLLPYLTLTIKTITFIILTSPYFQWYTGKCLETGTKYTHTFIVNFTDIYNKIYNTLLQIQHNQIILKECFFAKLLQLSYNCNWWMSVIWYECQLTFSFTLIRQKWTIKHVCKNSHLSMMYLTALLS